ncbi:cell division protein FtsL [Clostridium tepidiprofundi DSM 19306]|uniref:Cell division protein FtsL n=1 Tax=Clostridium tepidiprofundi DSM 19306 TaxID=1121338 RepID=A0A151B780_9CLOT|nr:cell division protein FtsL [Clostridium tepidiprofundi DSM 19306]
MNKLLEERYVNGNTALQVEREYTRKKENEKRLNRDELNRKNELREEQNRKRLIVLKSIMCVFIVGMIVVSRYSIIYGNEKKIRDIKKQIVELRSENDKMKIEILKFQDINKIDEIARKKLHMVEPSRVNVVYCNFDKEYFKSPDLTKVSKSKSLLSKLKEILF